MCQHLVHIQRVFFLAKAMKSKLTSTTTLNLQEKQRKCITHPGNNRAAVRKAAIAWSPSS